MHRLKGSQRNLVREFVTLAQVGEKTAVVCLSHHDWKLDIALDNFFANPEVYQRAGGEMHAAYGGYGPVGSARGGASTSAGPDRRKIEQLFAKYRDPSDNSRITTQGTIRLLEDLQLDPSSVTTLMMAWKFGCKTQCEFTDKEFLDGMIILG